MLLKISELLLIDTLGSHFNYFLNEGLNFRIIYVFGDDKDAVVCSKRFPDLLNLTRANVGEGCEDDLFVGAEQLIQPFDSLFLQFSSLCTTSH